MQFLSTETKLPVHTAEYGTKRDLEHGRSSVVSTVCRPEETFSAVKISTTLRSDQVIRREAAIHQELRHLLILELRESHSGAFGTSTTHVMKIAENGSLAHHFPSARGAEMCQVPGETRVARIIVDIVLAMRYRHSQRMIHCNLTADKVLLDCDCSVRIGGFRRSISSARPPIPITDESNDHQWWPSGNFSCVASECHANQYNCRNDVCSFALILCELVARELAFPTHLNQLAVARWLITGNKQSTTPAFVLPAMQSLMRQYWKSSSSLYPNPLHTR
jgi:serine/threonine protein kinase